MKCFTIYFQLIMLVSSLNIVYARVIKVPGKVPTIQAGIDAASAGDIVKVAAGTYNEDIILKSGVNVQGAGADKTTILGTGPGWVVTAVAVDAYATITGFTITGGNSQGIMCDNSSPVISNNVITGNIGSGIYCLSESAPTIINNKIMDNSLGIGCLFSSPSIIGNVIENNAGGILCGLSSPEITNNVIRNNTAEYGAGGITCYQECQARITNNVIIDNTSIRGAGGIDCEYFAGALIMGNTIRGNASILGGGAGGISCLRASPRIINNEIVANYTAGYGGGIELLMRSRSEVIGNKIMDNIAQYGGGIGVWIGEPVTFTNNVIAGNMALEGGGIYGSHSSLPITNNVIVGNEATVGGGVYSYWSALRVVNSILWENGDDLYGLPYIQTAFTTYSCIEDGDPGEGNISLNPLFVNAANGDYRLQGLSPCIDAGRNLSDLPSTDLLGNLRIVDGDGDSIAIVDMGPYEYVPQIIVAIDIRPGSDVNPINLRSEGLIPVALLTTDDVDAFAADIETVTFGPKGASPVHISSDDVDGDGDLDVVFHFRLQETGIRPDDVTATLNGTTTNLMPFVGTDSVTVKQ